MRVPILLTLINSLLTLRNYKASNMYNIIIKLTINLKNNNITMNYQFLKVKAALYNLYNKKNLRNMQFNFNIFFD